MNPLQGVGLVGCGFVARTHHVGAIAAAGGQVCATFDIDSTAARETARAAGPEATAHASLEALLGDRRVQTVAVCTPPAQHLEATCAALAAGRHVLVEKPLAPSLEDCDEMIRCRDRSGAIAAVGFNLRCHPLVVEARRMIGSGDLGSAVSLGHRWIGTSHRSDGDWSADPSAGGGLLTDRGSHSIDLVRRLAGGEITAVSAARTDRGLAIALELTGSGRTTAATITLAEAPAAVNRLWWTGEGDDLELDLYRFDGLVRVRGTDAPGSASARARAALRAPARLAAGFRAARSGGVFRRSYTHQWEAFAAAAADAEPSRVGAGLEDGRAAVAAIRAAAAAARDGERIETAPAPRSPGEVPA